MCLPVQPCKPALPGVSLPVGPCARMAEGAWWGSTAISVSLQLHEGLRGALSLLYRLRFVNCMSPRWLEQVLIACLDSVHVRTGWMHCLIAVRSHFGLAPSFKKGL